MNKRIEQIQGHQRALRREMEYIQSKCKHGKVKKEHKASTGNYDPSQDRYWTVFHCPTCDKRWREDGSK